MGQSMTTLASGGSSSRPHSATGTPEGGSTPRMSRRGPKKLKKEADSGYMSASRVSPRNISQLLSRKLTRTSTGSGDASATRCAAQHSPLRECIAKSGPDLSPAPSDSSTASSSGGSESNGKPSGVRRNSIVGSRRPSFRAPGGHGALLETVGTNACPFSTMMGEYPGSLPAIPVHIANPTAVDDQDQPSSPKGLPLNAEYAHSITQLTSVADDAIHIRGAVKVRPPPHGPLIPYIQWSWGKLSDDQRLLLADALCLKKLECDIPALRPVREPSRFEGLKRKIVKLFDDIVANVSTNKSATILRALGARHAIMYGVQDDMYIPVAKSFMSRFSELMGYSLGEDEQAAWETFIDYILEQLTEGAAECQRLLSNY